MPAQWTADLIGEMHLQGITAKQLAKEANLNAKYLSTILNGHVAPKGAEQTLQAALERIIAKHNQDTIQHVP